MAENIRRLVHTRRTLKSHLIKPGKVGMKSRQDSGFFRREPRLGGKSVLATLAREGGPASRLQRRALSATALFSSEGPVEVSIPLDLPCAVTVTLTLPPGACRPPRPRAPPPFNPPLGAARRGPPFTALTGAATLYPSLNCCTGPARRCIHPPSGRNDSGFRKRRMTGSYQSNTAHAIPAGGRGSSLVVAVW